MIRFVRRTFSIIDRQARLRFALFALGSVCIAGLEAAGVALVLPLIQLLVAPSEGQARLPSFLERFIRASSNEQAAAVLALLVVLTFTVKSGAAIALLRWGTGNSLKQEARIAKRLFSRYLRAPTSFHLKRNSSEIQRTLNESLLMVFRRTLPFIMAASADFAVLLAIAITIVASDPGVAVLAIAYFLLIGLLYQRFVGGRQKVAAKRAHTEVAQRYRQVQEAVRATKELAVLHREDYFVEQFYERKLELVAVQRVLVFFQLLPRHFLDLAFIFGAAAISFYTFATRSHAEALSSVGLFLTASFRLVAPLNRVLGTFTLARTAQPSIEQVLEDDALLSGLGAARPHERMERLGPSRLELIDVRFRYEDTDADVLRGVSLCIEPGDDVGIVGTSGAGKTTLLDVMLGLLDPYAGQILVGGQPLAQCRASWQVSIGYVPQEIVLIDDTIRANVAFGVGAEVDESQLQEALRLAQVDDFVASLPDGLETTVGEHGVRLSGGQRQRLGLARALYHRPIVLVFDEATSALDSETEARIMETIASLRGSLTIITVTHRLSTLKHCDRIYFLRAGSVAAVDTFEGLYAREPNFAQLVTLAQLSTSSSPPPGTAGWSGMDGLRDEGRATTQSGVRAP